MENNIQDREHKKFVESGGETSIRNTTLQRFGLNEIEEVGVITYFGKSDSEGNWLIMKIDETSGTVFSYAAIKNNSGVSTYSTAWTNRATITYGTYGEAL